METSASRKNSFRLWPVLLALAAVPLPASAEIIIVAKGDGASGNRSRMATLIVAPVPGTQASYMMQRSLAWSAYRRGDAATGLPLAATPALSGQATATSPRQASLRAHLARSQAYRLGYFNK